MQRAALILLCALWGLAGAFPALAVSERAGRGADLDYAELSYPALARLYWAMGVLDAADDWLIDGYLRLMHCDLYQASAHDEMAMAHVRDQVRDRIAARRGAFHTRFAVPQPLSVGAYDPGAQAFALDARETIPAGRSLLLLEARDAARWAGQGICGLKVGKEVPGYPGTFVVTLQAPAAVDALPMPPDAARAEMAEWARYRRGNIVERQAALVLYLRFTGAEDAPHILDAGTPRAQAIPHLRAELEGYVIFDSPSLRRALHRVDFREAHAP